MLELDIVQRFDERRVVLDPAFHRLERLLQPQARGIRARGIEPRRHLVLALDRGDEALVVGGVAIDRVPARRVHAERLIAHVLEDALVDECGIAEQRQLQAVLLVGAQKAQRIGAGEARIDAIDVALQLPGERAVVGYVERRPELLHHAPAAVLEHAMKARRAFVAVGEIVGDHRHALAAGFLHRVVAERVHRLRRGAIDVNHVVAFLLLREVVLRRRGRRDQRHLRLQDVIVDRQRLEGRERSDDDVHPVALDQLLRLALGERRLPGGVREDDLDLAAGERVVALFQQQADAFLHLPAARRERSGAHGEEADAQRFLLCIDRRGEQKAQQGEGARDDFHGFSLR